MSTNPGYKHLFEAMDEIMERYADEIKRIQDLDNVRFIEEVTGSKYIKIPIEGLLFVKETCNEVRAHKEAIAAWLWLCSVSKANEDYTKERDVFAGEDGAIAQRLGEELNEVAGVDLMRSVYYAYAWWLHQPTQTNKAVRNDNRMLEYAWDGIGEWQA